MGQRFELTSMQKQISALRTLAAWFSEASPSEEQVESFRSIESQLSFDDKSPIEKHMIQADLALALIRAGKEKGLKKLTVVVERDVSMMLSSASVNYNLISEMLQDGIITKVKIGEPSYGYTEVKAKYLPV
jgi:N-acyl-L-homoserine lactone synthetase